MTLADFMGFIKETISPAGTIIFAVLYWLEREERKEAQKELKAVTKESVQALTEVKTLVTQLATIFGTLSTRN